MTQGQVVHLAAEALVAAAKLAAPILVVSLAVGVAISLLQAVTQIQEMTLTFVPKLGAVALVLVFAGNWMLQELAAFTRELFEALPGLLR